MNEAARNYQVFETAMGSCAIAWSDAGVAGFQLPAQDAEAAERLIRRRVRGAEPCAPPAEISAIIDAAKRYFRGRGDGLLPGAGRPRWPGGVFREDLRGFAASRLGRTTTYGALAKAVGAGREAARDVGEAMACNPTPLIIPCHRVLAAGGKLGEFSAPGGSKTKARMLELEGVHVGPPEEAQQAFSF